MSTLPFTIGPELDRVLSRVQRGALLAGALAGVAVIAGAFVSPADFFRAWLMSWLLWLGIALGSLALEMLHFLTGGQWGLVTKRLLEAASGTLPLLGLLFVPLLFGMQQLYPWARRDVVAGDEILRHKQPYLNATFFVVRAVIYFLLWSGMAILIHRWAVRQNERAIWVRLRGFAGAGLVLYVFSMSFAALDWAQSLQPHWFSTIWGFLFVAGQGLSATAFVICAVVYLARHEPIRAVLTARQLHDLGKLLFMFVMLWAYLSFSQLLIIWAGDLPEENPWYIERLATNWGWVAVALLLFHFLFPFLLLLSRPLKRNARLLPAVALFLLLMRQVDLFWIVTPDLHRKSFHLHWLDLATPIALGGVWLAGFLWQLRRRPLLAVEDPRFSEVWTNA